jgi:hypothetical protein
MTLLTNDLLIIEVWFNETLIRGEAVGQLALNKDTPIGEYLKLVLDRMKSSHNFATFKEVEVQVVVTGIIEGVLILHNYVPFVFIPLAGGVKALITGDALTIQGISISMVQGVDDG